GKNSKTGYSTFDNALFDRLDRHPFGSDEIDRGFNFGLFAAQQHRHDANLILHAGLANVKHDVGEFSAHLPDDRLLDRLARAKGEPAALGVGMVRHGISSTQEPHHYPTQ